MTPLGAIEVATQLWQEAVRDAAAPADCKAAAERLLAVIDAGLRRWIGAEGYAALLQRATTIAAPSHAALAQFAEIGLDVPQVPLGDAPPRVFTDAESAEAMIGLLVVMMDVLGGIVGTDMAIRLMALSGTPSPRGLAGPETNDS